jgi:DMSO/TMAO reductase YedYZ molybdopterin-dependent catalytic subunit
VGDATPVPQPTPVTTVDPNIPVGDDGRILPAPGTRSELTPTPDFYRVDISASPVELDEDEWRLEVAGLFDKTPKLTIDDLKSYPVHVQPITLSCISNSVGGGAISTANWIGLRLSDLLEDLGMQSSAQSLYLDAADGFYETVVMDDLMDPRTLLVYGMNDVTLPVGHGFPLRIYIPNRFGMKQPKWIMRMEAIDGEGAGYWVDRGWSRSAVAKTTSVIDVVAKEAEHDGLVPVGGIAWAGSRGIQKVELEIDGEWVPVSLRTPPLGPLTWVQWRYDWNAAPGEHTLRVRATDGTGALQVEERTGARPDGATGYHTMDVQI